MTPSQQEILDAIETAIDAARQVTFKRFNVQPPGNEYVTLDDVLLLSIWSPTAISTVRLSVRVLSPDGQVDPRFETRNVQTIGAAPFQLELRNMEGFLLSASVTSPDAPRGQVFVTLEIVRGRGTADLTRGAILLAGYPDELRSVGYPESPARSSLDGRGLMRIVTGAVPAAGAEILDAVPAGRQWILRAARFQLTTAAAVANRVVGLAIDDGAGNIPAESTAGIIQVAALAREYSFAPGCTGLNGTTIVSAPWVFESRLLPGWRILTRSQALQAADQYTAAVYLVEEFITG
jgi:hypothetical protein